MTLDLEPIEDDEPVSSVKLDLEPIEDELPDQPVAPVAAAPTDVSFTDLTKRFGAGIAETASDAAAGIVYGADRLSNAAASRLQEGSLVGSERTAASDSLYTALNNQGTPEGTEAYREYLRRRKTANERADTLKSIADPETKSYAQEAMGFFRDVSDRAKDDYGVDPNRDSQFISKVASGAPSIIPAIAAGPAAPLVIGGMMGESGRKEAEQAGGTQEQQDKSFAANAAVGVLSESLLGIPALLRSAKAAGVPPSEFAAMVRRAAMQAIKSPLREGSQEALQQASSNIVASDIAAYDPERKATQGVREAAMLGAVIGAPVGVTVQVASDLDARAGERSAVQPESDTTSEPPPMPKQPPVSETADDSSTPLFSDPNYKAFMADLAAKRAAAEAAKAKADEIRSAGLPATAAVIETAPELAEVLEEITNPTTEPVEIGSESVVTDSATPETQESPTPVAEEAPPAEPVDAPLVQSVAPSVEAPLDLPSVDSIETLPEVEQGQPIESTSEQPLDLEPVEETATEPMSPGPGASGESEILNTRHTFATDVLIGLSEAKGEPATRQEWEKQFVRQYPELWDDTDALESAWEVAQQASKASADTMGRKPVPALVGQLSGETAGEGITGIRNKQADEERRARGLPAAMEPARRSNGRVWDEAMRHMDGNPQAQSELVQRLRDDPMATVDDRETAMLLHRQIELENRYDRAVDEVNTAWEKGDENAKVEATQRAREAEAALIEIYDVNKAVGTAQGRSLSARRMMAGRDYTLARMVAETRASKGGEELSDTERAALAKQHEEIQRTQAELDKREADLEQDVAEKNADAAVEELKAEANKQPTEEPLVRSIAERISAFLDKAADKARERLRSKFSRTSAGVDPTIIYDLSVIGASHIAKGILKLSRWTEIMVSDFGDAVRPYLDEAWIAANKRVDEAVENGAPKEKKEKVAKAVRKTGGEAERANIAEKMATRLADGDKLTELRGYIQKLALNFVKSGITTREGLVDAVHDVLKSMVPEITKRDTMDAISGYGDFKQLDGDKAKTQLRDLKGQLQQAAKLEDLQSKNPLRKTGVERRQPSDEERRLIRAVNEAKKKFGVVVTDPAKQLKSALDGVKTRLKNQIRDLTHQIDTGTKPKADEPIELDSETQALVALRDRVKQTLTDIEGKPEMTDEQRVKIATRSLEGSIAEYERRIREGETASKKKATNAPKTAEMDALRARKDALRAQMEELRAADTALQEEREFDALMRAGDALEQRLASGDVNPSGKGTALGPDTELITQAKERLSKLREAMTAARASSPQTRQAKLDAAVKAVESSIAAYDKRLKAGDISSKAKPSTVTSPELDALRAERDAMRAFLNDLRNAAKPKSTPEEVAIKTLKTRLATRNAELQEKIARGDFATKPRREVDISKDAEAVRLKAENAKWKKRYENAKVLNERANRTRMQKVLAGVREGLNLPRAILSSMDVSAVLRQGGFITFGNPVRAAKNLGAMFRALASENQARLIEQEILSRPNAPLYRAAKLYLAETGDVRLSAQEEAIMSELANRIPGIGASNRAYVTFLNKLRADSFDAMIGTLTRGGTPTKAELEAIANFVNVATGRGNMGSHATAATTLATIFFSPRLMLSRFQILAGQPLYGGSARTRTMIAKEYGKTLAGIAVVMALASLAGADIEDDPRSSDFGKLRFGNTRLDPLFGLAQVSVLMSRLVTGKSKGSSGKIVPIRGDKVPFGTGGSAEVIGRFLRTKLSPVVGTGVDISAGRNVVGEKIGPKEVAQNTLIPLGFRDIADVMKEHGVAGGTALTLLSMFGVGMQHYEERKKKD